MRQVRARSYIRYHLHTFLKSLNKKPACHRMTLHNNKRVNTSSPCTSALSPKLCLCFNKLSARWRASGPIPNVRLREYPLRESRRETVTKVSFSFQAIACLFDNLNVLL